jgi:hypothetical protein
MLEKDHYGIGRCPGPLKREVIQCCSATVLQSERRKRLEVEVKISHVKLPAHRAGLPGNEISFLLCPSTHWASRPRLQGGACGALAGQMT